MAVHTYLKQLLTECAESVSEADSTTSSDKSLAAAVAATLIRELRLKVSVHGDPTQRMGAYLLEALKSRLTSSWACMYSGSSESMAERALLNHVCPFWKFGYMSANAVLGETIAMEEKVHIIDFQIGQGDQWEFIIRALSCQQGVAPRIRISAVHAPRGGQKLVEFGKSNGVALEFEAVQLDSIVIRDGEAVAVNLPYVMYKMRDRDGLLRMVKAWSPRVVTLVEQEASMSSCSLNERFRECVEYYSAVFECIEAGAGWMYPEQRVRVEEKCVGMEMKNVVGCEGMDRVVRPERFEKWGEKLGKAGFYQVELNPLVRQGVGEMLKQYSSNYALVEEHGAVCLGWKNTALSTFSAWRSTDHNSI